MRVSVSILACVRRGGWMWEINCALVCVGECESVMKSVMLWINVGTCVCFPVYKRIWHT